MDVCSHNRTRSGGTKQTFFGRVAKTNSERNQGCPIIGLQAHMVPHYVLSFGAPKNVTLIVFHNAAIQSTKRIMQTRVTTKSVKNFNLGARCPRAVCRSPGRQAADNNTHREEKTIAINRLFEGRHCYGADSRVSIVNMRE